MKPLYRVLVLVWVSLPSRPGMCESLHVFGVHSWWQGCHSDIMSGRTGWVTEADLARGSPDVRRYEKIAGEGMTIIQRLDWDWETSTIPTRPEDHIIFASDCARWARTIGDYCHIWCIGNEMEIANYGGNNNYVDCFRRARTEIREVQEDAKVILGAFCNSENAGHVAGALGPSGLDGVAAHANSPPLDLVAELNNHSIPQDIGIYITEFGWLCGTNENPVGAMREIYDSIGNWNRQHIRQIYCANWFVYYSPGWENFALAISPPDNAAFEACTSLGTAVNSFHKNRVYTSDVWVEIGSTNAFSVEWETNVPATSQLWWRPVPQLPAEVSPVDQRLKTHHQRDGTWVFERSEYETELRSTASGMADAADGPVRFFSGPLEVVVTEVSPSWTVIEWETPEPCDSGVEYGLSAAYGSLIDDAALTRHHTVALSDLLPSQTYHFRVRYTAEGYANHRSPDLTFSVPAADPGAGMLSAY